MYKGIVSPGCTFATAEYITRATSCHEIKGQNDPVIARRRSIYVETRTHHPNFPTPTRNHSYHPPPAQSVRTMNFRLLLLLVASVSAAAGTSVCTGAAAQSTGEAKGYLVTFPHNAADSILENAINRVKEAGGVITNTFTIIRGFSFRGTMQAANSLNSFLVQAYQGQNQFTIEPDQTVTVAGGSDGGNKGNQAGQVHI